MCEMKHPNTQLEWTTYIHTRYLKICRGKGKRWGLDILPDWPILLSSSGKEGFKDTGTRRKVEGTGLERVLVG